MAKGGTLKLIQFEGEEDGRKELKDEGLCHRADKEAGQTGSCKPEALV